MSLLHAVFVFIRAFMVGQAALATENLALRQQLAVLHQSAKRPRLRQRDRVFWVWLSRLWKNWRSVLVIVQVQPDTVVSWHRQGFRLYWRWKSRRGKVGRPKIEQEIRDLIRRMSRENPIWRETGGIGTVTCFFASCLRRSGVAAATAVAADS